MDGVTWEYMFGRPYDGQLVDLRKKRNAPALAPAITALQGLVGKATVKPATAAEAWGKGAVTAHNAGAALDIYYHKDGDRTRAYAHGLLSLLIQNRTTVKWGSIEYNQMEFSPEKVQANSKDTEHFNHVHIDWIDYSRVKYSMKFTSFPYIDENGVQQTKQVSSPGQRMEMYWNAGARSAEFGPFTAAFDDLNLNFESLKDDLAALGMNDFQRLYGWDPRCGFPTPDWLNGWWDVRWRNEAYYYLFEANGRVRWTQWRPPKDNRLLIAPKDNGTCVGVGGGISIRWTTTGSVEEFRKVDEQHLEGTWNGTERLTATKMW